MNNDRKKMALAIYFDHWGREQSCIRKQMASVKGLYRSIAMWIDIPEQDSNGKIVLPFPSLLYENVNMFLNDLGELDMSSRFDLLQTFADELLSELDPPCPHVLLTVDEILGTNNSIQSIFFEDSEYNVFRFVDRFNLPIWKIVQYEKSTLDRVDGIVSFLPSPKKSFS